MTRPLPRLLLPALLALLASCSRGGGEAGAMAGKPGKGPLAMPVETTPVATQQVEFTVNAVGSLEAFEVVQVTARVSGAVEAIHFLEGTRVQAGDPLVEIEPRRYRLLADEARAAWEKATAAVSEAESGLARRLGANETTAGLIPGEEVEAWQTRVLTARAEAAAREAALQLAEKSAADAVARAPFAGVVQTRDVQTGRYVQPGALLATLVRRDPLLLRFQVPEGDAARLAAGQTARFTVQGAGERRARLVHVAESADEDTRMVAVTAQVESPDADLRPGAFAQVVVPVARSRAAVVVPQTAVRPSERGFLAYVVAGGKARERVLELGMRTPEGLVEVRAGLAPAESLVVRGAEALREGVAVRPGGAEGKARP
jgi:multidrug efflux system membrane fusion protein